MDLSINSVPVGSTGKLQNNIALPYDFTISSLITESWKRVKGMKAACWSALALYLLIYLAIIIAGLIATYLYAGSLDSHLTPVKTASTITRLLAMLITFPLPFGICLIAVRRSVNFPIKAKQMFEAYSFYGKILGTLVILYAVFFLIVFSTLFIMDLFSIIVIKTSGTPPVWLHGTVILLSILGGFAAIYFLLGLSYAPLLVIEKQLGVFQAVKTSFLAFRQHGLKIILTWFLMVLIYLVSAIPLGIGLIWTLPMFFNYSGVLYRTQFGVEKRP